MLYYEPRYGRQISPREQPLDRPHREKEATVMPFGQEELEPVVFVEGLRLVVLGVPKVEELALAM